MSEAFKLANLFLNTAVLGLMAGLGFTLGCAIVCRLMSWAPVNTTVVIHRSAANSEENAA